MDSHEIKLQDVELAVPAIKIKNVDAEIRDLTYEIIPDKVIVQGFIHKQIFYVGIDNIVHHQSDEMPFSAFVDVPGAVPGMQAQIDIIIEDIIAHLVQQGTVVVQKVVLEIFVKVEELTVVSVLLDPEGPLVELNQLIAEESKQFISENIVILNQAAVKIEEIRAQIVDLQLEIIPDKVIIQGVIHKQIFYINEQDTAVHQSEDIPFSEFIDIPGIVPGMDVIIEPIIEFVGFELGPDGLTVSQEIVINFNARVTQALQENIAEGIDLLVKLPVVIGENTRQVMTVNDLILEQPAQKIKDIIAEIRNITTDIINNKVIVQGIVHKQVFYIGNDDIEYHQAEDVPFATFLDIPGLNPDHLVRVEAVIENIIFNLLPGNILHQKIIIEVFVKGLEINQLYLDTDVTGLEVVLPVVIGENNKQILVEQQRRIPPIPPVGELVIENELILLQEAVQVCQQEILDDIIDLDRTAIKIKGIEVEVVDVEAELVLEDLVLLTGVLNKQISYVGLDNVVYHQNVAIPFAVEINLPQPITDGPLNPTVEIENISFSLLPGGDQLREIVVIEACVDTATTGQIQNVVTLISGSGITTTTIQARVEVVISEDPLQTEERIITIVTDVSDPEGLLTTVIKDVLLLDVVGDGIDEPVPVEVVVFAE